MTPRTLPRGTRIAVLALGLLACSAISAQAAYEPLASGQTRFILDGSFLRALRAAGISVSAKAPAGVKSGRVDFPVTGGKLDPTSGRGVVEHQGQLVLRAGARRIPLRDLQIKTTRKGSPLAAKVAGSQLKLATIGKLTVAPAGFGSRITVTQLSLSAKLATRLGKKLRARRVFRPGMPLGRTVTKTFPEKIALLGRNKAELNLAPGFEAKLSSLFVAVNPVFPAEHPGPFTLPVLGGFIAPDGTTGAVETNGALEFIQLGGGQILWHDPWVDLESVSFAAEPETLPSPPFPGKQDRGSVALLAPDAIVGDARKRTVSIDAELALDPGTAAAFNDVFARSQEREDVFVPGEPVGSVTLVGQGQ